jgi:hypothetical protein
MPLLPSSTITLLTLKSDFYRFQNEQFSSTATGGSTAKVTDSTLVGYQSETWPTKLENVQVRVTSGSASGNLRMSTRADRSEGDLYPNRAFSAALANGDTYELWGTSINGGKPLTDLFNDVIRPTRVMTETQVTIVTNQVIYDLTSILQTARDINSVRLHLVDPTGQAPYRVKDLTPGLDWTAYDSGGAGTSSVTLELSAPLTQDDTILTLWIRAETVFTPFADDTSTVDAAYRDWLTWEAILEHCQRKLTTTVGDSSRWTKLRDRAISELASYRARWMPREPTQIHTFP